jgi:hypothetical protein
MHAGNIIASRVNTIINNFRFIDDEEFFEIALSIFHFQMEKCKPYSDYVKEIGTDCHSIKAVYEIPPLPEIAFKNSMIGCFKEGSAEATFITSGTTTGIKGRHFIKDLSLYEASLRSSFRKFCIPDVRNMTIFSLIPEMNSRPYSSLSYMLSSVVRYAGTPESRFFPVDSGIGKITGALSQQNNPVLLAGTAIDLFALTEEMAKKNIRIRLPDRSRIFETGGMKGRKQELKKEDFHDKIVSGFGIKKKFIISEFGMTELLSQAYDSQIFRCPGKRCFRNPPWMKTFVLDPGTMKPVRKGKGILCHYDLCNVWSCMGILTSDIGEKTEEGFLIHGRTAGSEPRGCSLEAGI